MRPARQPRPATGGIPRSPARLTSPGPDPNPSRVQREDHDDPVRLQLISPPRSARGLGGTAVRARPRARARPTRRRRRRHPPHSPATRRTPVTVLAPPTPPRLSRGQDQAVTCSAISTTNRRRSPPTPTNATRRLPARRTCDSQVKPHRAHDLNGTQNPPRLLPARQPTCPPSATRRGCASRSTLKALSYDGKDHFVREERDFLAKERDPARSVPFA